ncbi:type VI secretion system tube protein Hcp, partial [Pseudomonas aeruginosa]|uniref:type VI secretion system tube protein TssD n=1 Tax=Pseudomonas aeruginosa TaxID=287 RepID=UPI002021BAB4
PPPPPHPPTPAPCAASPPAGAFTEDSVGNTYQEGHEDQVMVQGFNHEVIIPRDPQSGQPTGQRVHKPVVITKVFDKASPLLL